MIIWKSSRRAQVMAGDASANATQRQPQARGFSPPRWIVSTDSQSALATLGPAAVASAASSASQGRPQLGGGLGSRRWPDDGDDRFTPYGPTTRRQGPMRFVAAKNVPAAHSEDKRPELPTASGIAQDKGSAVRSIYESIVLKPPAAAPKPPPLPPPPPPPDLDLTLDDEDEEGEEDDDLNIIDPLTGETAVKAPLIPRRRSQRPLGINELLPPRNESPLVPRALPTQYGIKPSSIGWKLLAKAGWKEGESLGPVEDATQSSKRLKVPLKASEKFDRSGLGVTGKDGPKKTRREMEEERKRLALIERDRRGKGRRGIERQQLKEKQKKMALLFYMNH